MIWHKDTLLKKRGKKLELREIAEIQKKTAEEVVRYDNFS